MSDSTAEFESKLDELRTLYVAGFDDKMADIVQGWQATLRGCGEEQRESMIRKVHSFAGSGAMYGFSVISAAARSLERTLVSIAADNGGPTPNQIKEGEAGMENLRKAISDSREALHRAAVSDFGEASGQLIV